VGSRVKWALSWLSCQKFATLEFNLDVRWDHDDSLVPEALREAQIQRGASTLCFNRFPAVMPLMQ
jgi:hypothetical protein